MSPAPIIYECRGSVALIYLNAPEKRNALSLEMLAGLRDTLGQIQRETSIRVVILTGSGNQAFSSGTDINELKELSETEARETARLGQSVCDQIADSPLPVIAAVNGLAAGGGCELALACHMRLASSNAAFSLPETKLGIIPGYGATQRLPREIGRVRAIEIMLTGRTLPAAEAFRAGLVNRVTEAGSLLVDADSLANEIAQLAPLAIRACLRAVNRGFELPLAEGLALETELFASLFASNDMREGTRAFLEKRKPVFNGT
jgi:enoyl-CoA hydratase